MNNNHLHLVLLLLVGLCFSCGQTSTEKKETPRETLVQRYYEALNTEDFVTIKKLIADSITQISGPSIQTWSNKDFTNWLAWDASFSPSYRIYSTEAIADDKVQLTLSKTCKRIQFLNEEPAKYVEVFHFNGNKIRTIEAGELLVFNDSLWVAKRDTLIAYTRRNHPELDGFIYDQTKTGAEKYLKALALFEKAQHKIK